MAWSEEARAAAAEARRRKSQATIKAMDANSGFSRVATRSELAQQIRRARQMARSPKASAGSRKSALAQLKNQVYAAKVSTSNLRMRAQKQAVYQATVGASSKG